MATLPRAEPRPAPAPEPHGPPAPAVAGAMTERLDVSEPKTAEPGAPGLPIVRDAVRRVLTRMFGPPPFDPNRDPGDPGLTGPGSPSWRIIGEPAAIAGGIRGLLAQVSHPLAMAGVHDHSAFREDPLGRLQRTSAYVTTSTFGSTAEAISVAGRVRAVHPRVHGTAPDGRPYRADDPRLLVWVSISLTSSFLTVGTRRPHACRGGSVRRRAVPHRRAAGPGRGPADAARRRDA
jgi:hypothetical protein